METFYSTPDQQKRDYDDVSMYFPEYVAPSVIHADGNNCRYLITQNRLDGGNIMQGDSPEVLSKLVELAELNRRSVRDAGFSLEFMGAQGMKECLKRGCGIPASPQISNVLKDIDGNGEGDIKITDITLLRLSDRSTAAHRALLLKMLFRINRQLLRAHFDIEIA